MEKTGSYGKDGYLWKRQVVMEDGQLWKRRAVMEKTGTYGKEGNKAFKSEIFYSHRAQPVLHI